MFRGSGPGGQPWQRSITFVPVALDETAHLVNSRSSVTVTPDAEGYFEAVLWAGAWRAEFADGTSFPFPVVAGTSERLVDLRGYVPPPGTTVQVVALAGVDVETLEPDDPATGEWRVDRLKLGLPRGNQGDKGDAATISVGSTTTGAPDTPADVTNSGDSHNAVCHFTIPAGHDGREVEFGLSATHVQWRYVGDVAWMDLIALSSLVGATGAQGPKGDDGDPAPLPAFEATATTGAPGTNADASVSGTYPDLSLDLTIPRGDKGDPGPPNALTIGTVTTGAPGSAADASITGTAPEQVLNLTIPIGATGAVSAWEYYAAGRPDIPATLDPAALAWRNAAPSGSTFYSTGGPQGAWVWRKRGANWVCVEGDTGYIEVQGKLLNGWAQSGTRHVTLRRVGDLVTLAGMLVSPPSEVTIKRGQILALPTSFLPCQPPSPPEHPLPRGDDPMEPAASRLPRLRR